jgi:hypothetical protein
MLIIFLQSFYMLSFCGLMIKVKGRKLIKRLLLVDS